jgi:hypothetical protein
VLTHITLDSIEGRLRALGWADRELQFVHPDSGKWLFLVEQAQLLTERGVSGT